MKVRWHPHALGRLVERGATEEEVMAAAPRENGFPPNSAEPGFDATLPAAPRTRGTPSSSTRRWRKPGKSPSASGPNLRFEFALKLVAAGGGAMKVTYDQETHTMTITLRGAHQGERPGSSRTHRSLWIMPSTAGQWGAGGCSWPPSVWRNRLRTSSVSRLDFSALSSRNRSRAFTASACRPTRS